MTQRISHHCSKIPSWIAVAACYDRTHLAALGERVARLEGAILGPRDFARDTGTGNTT